MDNTIFQGWTATLSNGENAWEQSPVADEKTSWQKLIDRLNKNNLKITSLRVQRNGITLHALSAKQCDGYFQGYEKHSMMISGKEFIQQGCGSVVGDKVFIQWIDDNNNIHAEVRSLSEAKFATTLRDS
jgi:hypothetical protein